MNRRQLLGGAAAAAVAAGMGVSAVTGHVGYYVGEPEIIKATGRITPVRYIKLALEAAGVPFDDKNFEALEEYCLEKQIEAAVPAPQSSLAEMIEQQLRQIPSLVVAQSDKAEYKLPAVLTMGRAARIGWGDAYADDTSSRQRSEPSQEPCAPGQREEEYSFCSSAW
jgi:hypothetical protein